LSRLCACRGDVCLLVCELLAISSDDNARVESEQEEDKETEDQPSIVRSEDALATLADLIRSLSSLSSVGGDSDVNGRSNGCNGSVRLLDALRDEVVLERLVEHGNGNGDRVSHGSEELEP